MKNQKVFYYILKWLALIFISFLIIKENHPKILMFTLIGFVSAILILEGIREFKTKGD
jgi:hypothetical protein